MRDRVSMRAREREKKRAEKNGTLSNRAVDSLLRFNGKNIWIIQHIISNVYLGRLPRPDLLIFPWKRNDGIFGINQTYPCWPPSLFFESRLCCETLESDPERLRDSAPSDMELLLCREDFCFFFILPPPLPFPVALVALEDSTLVLTDGEFGAFPSNSSKKSCNKNVTIYITI